MISPNSMTGPQFYLAAICFLSVLAQTLSSQLACDCWTCPDKETLEKFKNCAMCQIFGTGPYSRDPKLCTKEGGCTYEVQKVTDFKNLKASGNSWNCSFVDELNQCSVKLRIDTDSTAGGIDSKDWSRAQIYVHSKKNCPNIPVSTTVTPMNTTSHEVYTVPIVNEDGSTVEATLPLTTPTASTTESGTAPGVIVSLTSAESTTEDTTTVTMPTTTTVAISTHSVQTAQVTSTVTPEPTTVTIVDTTTTNSETADTTTDVPTTATLAPHTTATAAGTTIEVAGTTSTTVVDATGTTVTESTALVGSTTSRQLGTTAPATGTTVRNDSSSPLNPGESIELGERPCRKFVAELLKNSNCERCKFITYRVEVLADSQPDKQSKRSACKYFDEETKCEISYEYAYFAEDRAVLLQERQACHSALKTTIILGLLLLMLAIILLAVATKFFRKKNAKKRGHPMAATMARNEQLLQKYHETDIDPVYKDTTATIPATTDTAVSPV